MVKPWDPKHEAEIDQLLASRDMSSQALPPATRARVESLSGAAIEVMNIVDIYIHGFAQIQENGPLVKVVNPKSVRWVQTAGSRSPARLAGIVATHMCSLLEEFINEQAKARLTAAFVSSHGPRLVARLTRSGSVPKKPDGITKELLRAVKPSVFADGATWAKAVAYIFSVKLEPCVENTLLPMISYRNRYVHEPQNALSTVVTGEELISWIKAVLLLAQDIALAS
ncbi:hypothetical protein WME99_23395 [Sorangium sp. So ce136]|uniref:hypothetical protein n=1 Tax=Sorangium sp. So ce136 TaxID=3133284 RepID=UPI003F0735B3